MTMIKATEWKKLVNYHPTTGVLNWIVSPNNNVPAGTACSQKQIKYKGHKYHPINVIYAIMTGEYYQRKPKPRDGREMNYRWSNIKPVTERDERPVTSEDAFKIEKNIPIPTVRGHDTSSKYPLLDMKIGDSFFVPTNNDKDKSTVASGISYWAKRINMRGCFTRRTVKGGLRIWRVK